LKIAEVQTFFLRKPC